MNCPIDNPNCPYGKLQTGEKCPACGKIKKDEETSYMIEKGKARGRARKIMSAAERSAAAKKGWETRRRNGFKAKGDKPNMGSTTRSRQVPPGMTGNGGRAASPSSGPKMPSSETRQKIAEAVKAATAKGGGGSARMRRREVLRADGRSARRKSAPGRRMSPDAIRSMRQAEERKKTRVYPDIESWDTDELKAQLEMSRETYATGTGPERSEAEREVNELYDEMKRRGVVEVNRADYDAAIRASRARRNNQ